MTGTVVFDLDGVVYLGEQTVPGAGAALERTQGLGLQILFCTNNSSRTRTETAAKIERVTGFAATADQVLSSATAAGNLIAGRAARAFIVGGGGIVEALAENGVEATEEWARADVVVAGVDFEFTYRKLSDAVAAIRGGAWFVATNTDSTYPTPEGLAPGAGAIVAAIERATGTDAFVAGKPELPMRELISGRLDGGPVWVVGDRPETDLAMALAEGWTSVLVLTGVTAASSPVAFSPDVIATSITEVPGLISSF